MIITASVLSLYNYNINISKSQIEEKARALGMKYPDDINVINKEVGKW